MKSRLILVIVSLSLLAACGGGKSSSSTSTSTGGAVSISPSTASVATNTTAQFTANVSNSSSGVYWSVNGVIGGNLTNGTVSTNGLYTAPATVPSPATVTITATSLSDTSQSASATITVTAGTALSLTVSPSTASVYTGRTLQFSTTFNTTANTGVTWEVGSTTAGATQTIGGESTHGTISSSGLYTAPATVPSPATVLITAISQADPTKTATATVTVVLGSTIVITPNIVNVPAGGTQVFNATVCTVVPCSTNTPIAVTWALSCNSTVTNGCGTVATAGGTANASATYTAPAFPPPGGAVSITATSTDQSALPASANVVVQVSNGALVGSYAYSFAGKNSGTAYAAAGSITFDGSGAITGGGEDINSGSASSATITGGSYHIGTDGRGNATVQTSAGTETWQIVIKDNTKAYIMRADAGVTGTGTMYLQDKSKFAIASVSGNYSLRLSGAAAGQVIGSTAVAGAFTASGAGVISAGKLDTSAGTTATTAVPATGLYTAPVSTTGRGTLLIGSINVAYYLVDATRAVMVETDAGKPSRGDIVKQPATTFTAGSYAGSYAMLTSGSNASVPVAVGSIFALDGASAVSSGIADVNTNGNVQSGVAMTGTYAVTDATFGRAELTVTINGQARKFVLYPESTGVYAVLEIDGVQTTSGRAYLQTSNVTTSLWTGSYAGAMAGTDFINAPGGEEDAVGLFVPNGGSALSGSLDINDGGTIFRNSSVSGNYLPSATAGRLTGSVTTTFNGLSSGQFVFYIIDANRALVMESDSSRILVGQMEKP